MRRVYLPAFLRRGLGKDSARCRTSLTRRFEVTVQVDWARRAGSPVDLEVTVAQPLGQGDRVRGGRHGHRRVQPDSMRSLVGFGGVGASRQIEVTRRAGNI